MRIPAVTIFVVLVFRGLAGSAAQDGSLEGALEPPEAPALVSATREGGVVATTGPTASGGKFRMLLPAGTYSIEVTSPVSSFPIRMDTIIVKPGETTVLPTILITAGSGKAVLSGRIVPPGPDSEVSILFEGRQRASMRTDREGRYEFRDLPAGTYEVRASAPGHAQDRAPVSLPENQRVHQTSVLLPVVATDGVDWAAGTIRATGFGNIPPDAVNPAQARAMSQRAAIADAQRNMLRIVRQVRIDGKRTVGTLMNTGSGAERIQGFLRGYTLAGERQLEDGRTEVVIELPLTGPQGLSRFLVDQ